MPWSLTPSGVKSTSSSPNPKISVIMRLLLYNW
jgi:hypothetical protein